MSTIITDTEITAQKVIEERTWRATQYTEDQPPHDGSTYLNTIFRERKTSIEGLPPSYSRERVEPQVILTEGQDGTDPSHYSESIPGFEPEVTAKMFEVLAYPRTETIMVTDPATGTDYTVPAAIVPLFLVKIYDMVAEKANQAILDAAIAHAVAEAIDVQAAQGSPAE